LDRFLAFAIAAVPRITPVAGMGRIPEVVGQFSLQRTLNEPFRQLPEQAVLPEDILRVGVIFQEFVLALQAHALSPLASAALRWRRASRVRSIAIRRCRLAPAPLP